MKAATPRVAVVFNPPQLASDHPDAVSEADVVDVADAVRQALRSRGFVSECLSAAPPVSAFVVKMMGWKPNLVFNLAEGFNGVSAGATHLTSLFELLALPYTGSPVEALAACVSKSRAKALLRGFGLPTTDSIVIEPQQKLPRIAMPNAYLVKPDAEDGSLGIDQNSVVNDSKELAERVQFLREHYHGAVIVEPYLPGSEFNIGIIALPEPQALAVAQIVFRPEIGRWPMLTYEAKWDEGSIADLASLPLCPAPIDEKLAGRLSALAVAAFRATGCRDYARVDMRLDAEGRPMILEVNPNPDIGPNAGWARAARVSGYTYEDAIGLIAEEALRRGSSRNV